ncbi:hypothetical protein B7494_g2835 [Chlorociboria aeruginascens]|nr:hypothetical protein B7494_g2835 [Chlorociboria aeruginascens]
MPPTIPTQAQPPPESASLILQEFLDELDTLIATSRNRRSRSRRPTRKPLDTNSSTAEDSASYIINPDTDWEFQRPTRDTDSEAGDESDAGDAYCDGEEKYHIPSSSLPFRTASPPHSSSDNRDRPSESENRDHNTSTSVDENSGPIANISQPPPLPPPADIFLHLMAAGNYDPGPVPLRKAASEGFADRESSDREEGREEERERERESRESREIMLAAVATAALVGVLWIT